MIKDKKVFVLSAVSVLLLIFIVSDLAFYKHTLKNNISGFLAGNFGTVGLVGMSSTTSKVATSTAVKKMGNIPPESPANYKDNNNGTITDNLTGLVWVKCVQGMSGNNCSSGSPSLLDFPKASAICGRLNLAGKNDWRIPTLKELESIVNTAAYDPSINKDFFLKTSADPYWTSTSPAEFRADNFTVLFSDGSVYHQSIGSPAATRCVRG